MMAGSRVWAHDQVTGNAATSAKEERDAFWAFAAATPEGFHRHLRAGVRHLAQP